MTGMTPRDCRRHDRVFSILWILARPFFRPLFGYRWEPLPRIDGPIFLLCNHNTDLDCAFLGLSAHRTLYFVATETIARMGLAGKILMRCFNPILHNKGTVGAGTSRAILERLRAGKSVALFPEGNRSFNGQTCPIPPATGKLARLTGATLVTYLFTGGYFTTPRWGRGLRRGRLEGHVRGVYSPETLKNMKPEEIQTAIERDLWTDAYEEQREHPVRFRGRRPAEYLESTLFLCPSCGGIGGLRSKKDVLSCACGCRLRFTPYGYLEEEGGASHTITELDRAQQEKLADLAAATGEACVFSDPVLLRQVEADHSVSAERELRLSAFRDRFEAGEQVFPMEEIEAVSVVQRNRLLFYPAGSRVHYECTGAPGFNALKYLYLFRLIRPSANGGL